MRTYSRFQLWYGRDEAPVATRLLRAGPVEALLDGRDLRYLRVGGIEVVRRLYVAVRDHNWNTIPGELSNLQVQDANDHFDVRFDVRHRRGTIDFQWGGHIWGDPTGTIRYTMDGLATSDFRYNRIGFCVLHPPAESTGRPYRGRTPTAAISGRLPVAIEPQRLEEGIYIPTVPAVDQLAIDGMGGVTVRFDFEGDLFEMEDQRNWTDNSFKTYCTPLYLPFPKDARSGQEIRQKVTVTVERRPAQPTAGCETGGLCLLLGENLGRALPAIGLGMASHNQELSVREIDLLRQLSLDHLRVDLHLQEPEYPRRLQRGITACALLGCRLELALFLADDATAQLDRLAAYLRPRPPVARFLIFHENEESTAGRWVRLARERLRGVAGDAEFAGGTNAYFCELNRSRPELEDMDAVAYSLNPQVHAFDETSMVETLATQGETVRSARLFCGDRRLIVSPVTLKPRFNPSATAPEGERSVGELPPEVDPRQMSLFAAGWTVGSIKYLSENGAAALTYYETTGWRGVMETEQGSPHPDRFPSEAGMVFPLYHVFADLAEWKSAELLACRSNDPFAVEALAVRSGGAVHTLIANLTSRPQRVRLQGFPRGHASVRHLDTDSALLAMYEPTRFRSTAKNEQIRGGELVTELAPYALTCITARGDSPREDPEFAAARGLSMK